MAVSNSSSSSTKRLHHDVHGAFLELGEAELEAHRVELVPGDSGFVRGELLADAAVARDEVERELADVARFDLADPARDEVIVEKLHRPHRANES
jgi:hypothetical protein